MLAIKLWFKAAWEWLKKYWKWLIFPAGILLYIIGRLSAKKEVTVVSPGLVAHEEVKNQLEAEAAQKKAQADLAATTQLSEIAADHNAQVASATKQQISEIEAAQGKPEEVTDLLKRVGKEIREGKR